MHHSLKVFTLLFFTTTLSQGTEVFVDRDSMSLAQISLTEKYCKNISKERTLCKQKAFSYIDFNDKDLPQFLHGLKDNLTPVVKTYHQDDLKSSTLADIKDFDGDISGEWYNASTLNLFAKTEQTYTLSIASEGYTGGAHGYHAIAFENYNIETQKILKLQDLFLHDSNTTLLKVALKQYRISQELKPEQSLRDDGWFNNTFLLAENFAITKRGLLFYYNSYEIKSYAAGHTQFMLPYTKIRQLIDPNGPLKFALEKKKTMHVSFYEKNEASLELDVTINNNQTITLVATMENLSYLDKSWFSLSFPQIDSKKQILSMKKKGFTKLNAYDNENKIYHHTLNKAVKAKYLLVEAETKRWREQEYSITLTVKAPMQSKAFIIDMRANLKSKEKSLNIPNYEGIVGQQGYENYRIFVEL